MSNWGKREERQIKVLLKRAKKHRKDPTAGHMDPQEFEAAVNKYIPLLLGALRKVRRQRDKARYFIYDMGIPVSKKWFSNKD